MLLPKRSNMFSLVSLGLNSDQRRISTSSIKAGLCLVLDCLKHKYIFLGGGFKCSLVVHFLISRG